MRVGAIGSMCLMGIGLLQAALLESQQGEKVIHWGIFALFATPVAGLLICLMESLARKDVKQSVLIVGLYLLLLSGIWVAGVL